MKYQDHNDETLVMLTLAGEVCAYEVLVARYERAVIAAANSVLHSRYMAEDAAQDAFITAWIKLDMLRDPSKYASWVCRIARNCAVNIASRCRGSMSLGVAENIISGEDWVSDPELLYVSKEEKTLLHESIAGLPEKVRRVIYMHYFEELSVAEIADRLRVSAGTVKAQLHDGRKRMRKELCAVNEQANDTLVQRVMKKVEELKLWQFKKDKSGFEAVYGDVLADVCNLPESEDKYHALADVLMRGWWWIPGEKNDALFKRIGEAAELGKNEDVIEFVTFRECNRLHGRNRLEFIRDKQIPRLEAAGFKRAAAYRYFWLADAYFSEKEPDKGFEAYAKVLSMLPPSDPYHTYAAVSVKNMRRYLGEFKDKSKSNCRVICGVDELRFENGMLRRWEEKYNGEGYMTSAARLIDHIFSNASECDGIFYKAGMAVGDTYVGSDGTTLTFAADDIAVDTPCGRFDNCHEWVTKDSVREFHTYYKIGVGIVKQVQICEYTTETRILKAYSVSGDGYIPIASGNTWEYDGGYSDDILRHGLHCYVSYCDGRSAIVGFDYFLERLKYDENSWVDMVSQIREEYFDSDKSKVMDVTHPMERAKALARTEMEKVHTRFACSVARRILDTNKEFNPDCTSTGHWNFFERRIVRKKDGKLKRPFNHDYRWSFELKCMDGSAAMQPLLYNNIYGILEDIADCIWSDEWVPGYKSCREFLWWDHHIKSDIICEEAGTVTTAAGVFENCLRVSFDTSGFEDGLDYIGGKKEYYFAPGIGIVRTVNHFFEGCRTSVYELSSYDGVGEGYMPFFGGMARKYEAVGLTDGYVGSADYIFVDGDDGNTVMFEDRCGIKNQVGRITRYEYIFDEMTEDNLWESNRRDAKMREAVRVRNAVNNFNIMQHLLGRDARNWAAASRAVATAKQRMRIIESLSEDGSVPSAWFGAYVRCCFMASVASFGCGTDESKAEGYRYLERTFELVEEWEAIPDGEMLSPGDETFWCGIKISKGGDVLILPDGTVEPLYDKWLFSYGTDSIYYGMTAKSGWEWFNPVRGEDRFKEYIDRARELMNGK